MFRALKGKFLKWQPRYARIVLVYIFPARGSFLIDCATDVIDALQAPFARAQHRTEILTLFFSVEKPFPSHYEVTRLKNPSKSATQTTEQLPNLQGLRNNKIHDIFVRSGQVWDEIWRL